MISRCFLYLIFTFSPRKPVIQAGALKHVIFFALSVQEQLMLMLHLLGASMLVLFVV